MRFIVTFLAALLLLPACAGTLDTGPGLPVISNQFSEAMRWQDYIGAGNFLGSDVRSEFLNQFQQDEDLRVVESRIVSVGLKSDADIVVADYELEYYRLPSMRVKKWHWAQEWQLQSQKGLKTGVWLITNSPPPLP